MLAPVLVTPPDCLAVLFHSVDVNDRLIATILRARSSNSSKLSNFFRFDFESILHSLKVVRLLRTFYVCKILNAFPRLSRQLRYYLLSFTEELCNPLIDIPRRYVARCPRSSWNRHLPMYDLHHPECHLHLRSLPPG